MAHSVQVESAAVSDRGLSDKRPQNEDSYLELPERGIFAVADGVGGAQAGDVASQMAVEILGEAFSNRVNGDAEDVMKIALERANSAIFQMASDLPQLASMATTIVAVHLSGDVATIGHVGDSRLYRFDAKGNVFRETNDHSVVEEEVRAGRMSPEEAAHHPSKNIISRALGAEGTVEIDLKTILAGAGTTFLLCSDGITRHIEDPELREIFASHGRPDDICRQLKDLCYSRGAEDNLTAVVVRVGDAENSARENDQAEDQPDEDEVTIATARSPLEDTIAADEIANDAIDLDATVADEPFPEGPERDDESNLVAEPDNQEFPASDAAAAGAGTDGKPTRATVAPSQIKPTPQDRFPVGESSENRVRPLGSVVSSIASLLLGALLGAGAYYFWQQSNLQPEVPAVQPPAITEMKSNNTALTAFEEGRRQVDSDPAKYLNANAASPQDAADYFLLGRAYMQTGKFWDAKRSFNEAKSRLGSVESENAKTLSAEIAMALAIIESPSATDSFSRNFVAANAASDSNSAPPASPER
jgi:protein phosphatase